MTLSPMLRTRDRPVADPLGGHVEHLPFRTATLPVPRAADRLTLHLLLGVLGFATCSAWALLDPRFRDAERFPTGEIVVPLAVAMAVLVLAWAGPGQWAAAARWVAVAAIGQAVSLQMIDAGPLIHYQHVRPDAGSGLWLALVGIQTGLVVIGLHGRWRAVVGRIHKLLPGWRLAVVAGISLVSAAALSRDPLAFATELPLAAFIQLVNLGTAVLLAANLPASAVGTLRTRLDRWLGPLSATDDAEPGGLDRFAALSAAWVVTVCAVLAAFIYERHPHVPDEVIYLFPARYFAHGLLTLPAPPVPEAFQLYLMDVVNGRWFSPVQPGWPAVLAIGAWLDVPWLVDPIVAGLNVLLSYVLLREMYDRRTARLAALLLCASPWFLFMGMSFMTHQATLFCALAPAVLLARARRTGQIRGALLAGAVVGFGALIRQLDGLLVGSLLGVWLLAVSVADLRRPARSWRLALAQLVAFGVTAGLVTALWLPINLYLSGSPTTFPLEAYLDRTFGPGRNALGFGPDRGLGWPLEPLPGHSPLKALLNGLLNLFSVNVELLGWATGSILLVVAPVFSGRIGRREWLALAVIGAVVGTYSLYWYSGGPDFGARYWFIAVPAFLVLVARGLQAFDRLFPGRVLTVAIGLCILSVGTYVPWRAFDKYHHYLDMRPDVPALAESNGFGRSLVVVRGQEHPDYASAFVYNPLDLHSDAPVYVHDRGPAVDSAIVMAYADRPIWILDGPSVTHAGYQVVAGPLSLAEALKELASGPSPSPL